ncbi:aminotransferase class III-fold pyridoxal phosphate-dependent enzyme [Salinirubellus sp. GCM10025818]|uniref:aminotransferase class III-fold pyridoxal phosphate-dependent enzyme n=1 Tax=Salinirubellus TaxID=2162630 RepID=UPI0030D0ECE0
MDRETATPRIDSMPGERARAWVEHHREAAAPSEHSHAFVWDITADAEGPFVTDVDGNVLMDFTCHIGAAPLGYGNPKILEKVREFDLVEPLKIAGQDLYFAGGNGLDDREFPGSSRLMHELVDRSSQYGHDTVFLSNSGGEAVENAMKVAYDACERPKYGITFTGAFHGRTLGTLSITRAKDVYTRKFPEIAGIREVPFCADRTCSPGTCDCGFFRGSGSRSRLEELFAPEFRSLDPAEVAYIVMEPIQGVGGYNFPSEAFTSEVARVSERYDIPLIVDEIQTGVGRSGRMWASDHYDLEPDLITAGKALRVGATVGRGELFPDEPNRLGSTWGGGDVVSSMYGVFTLEAIDEYDLTANATERGRQMRELLADADPEGVVDVRGLGLLLAVEFDTAERRDAVVEAALSRGLMTLGCGKKTVRLLPPLDVTEREIELGGSLFVESVEAVA